MTSKAFLHINGVDYELPFEVTDVHDQSLQQVRNQIARLNGPGAQAQIFDVVRDGRRGSLEVAANAASVVGLLFAQL